MRWSSRCLLVEGYVGIPWEEFSGISLWSRSTGKAETSRRLQTFGFFSTWFPDSVSDLSGSLVVSLPAASTGGRCCWARDTIDNSETRQFMCLLCLSRSRTFYAPTASARGLGTCLHHLGTARTTASRVVAIIGLDGIDLVLNFKTLASQESPRIGTSARENELMEARRGR